MRLGVFSDIHGNAKALEAVWASLRGERCDRYVFLGDICGYYYGQNEAIALLKTIPDLIAIAGNHDRIFLDAVKKGASLERYTKRYGRSLEIFQKTATQESIDYLAGLPLQWFSLDKEIALFHGSPWDPDEYIYPDSSLERFEDVPWRWVFLGHTHYAMDRKFSKGRIINPGSCGQPRDALLASYAVVDTGSGEVVLRRVDYDRKGLIKEIMEYEEKNSYLTDALVRQRNS